MGPRLVSQWGTHETLEDGTRHWPIGHPPKEDAPLKTPWLPGLLRAPSWVSDVTKAQRKRVYQGSFQSLHYTPGHGSA